MALDPRLDDVADISDLSGADLALVVELQRKELDRLLRENAQLHARVNQLIGLQEREQVLRQQMQSMMGTPKAEMPTALLEITQNWLYAPKRQKHGMSGLKVRWRC